MTPATSATSCLASAAVNVYAVRSSTGVALINDTGNRLVDLVKGEFPMIISRSAPTRTP